MFSAFRDVGWNEFSGGELDSASLARLLNSVGVAAGEGGGQLLP